MNQLTAAGFAKVRHGTQLGVDWPPAEPTVVEVGDGLGCVLLGAELDVDVADKVVAQVVADVHFLDFTVPATKRIGIAVFSF